MHIEKNILIKGSHGKPIATDIFYKDALRPMPAVIYAHGFNGFKDWANFDLIAAHFAEQGFVFIKFNFSHNGTIPDHPEEFIDLEAYADNNYIIELDDLGNVIDWVTSAENPYQAVINTDKVYLIGHSLGGGIAILKASEDKRIKKLVTWASISECKTPWGTWTIERLNDWQSKGVTYIENTRTKQQMPLNYQLYENFQQNAERLDIQEAISNLSIPILICHGSNDTSVPVRKAYDLHTWNPSSNLFIVDSDHVFGRKHPWDQPFLPVPMQAVVNKTVAFLS